MTLSQAVTLLESCMLSRLSCMFYSTKLREVHVLYFLIFISNVPAFFPLFFLFAASISSFQEGLDH